MAYEPTVWQCGDTVTADKMNKIEQGIANAGSGGSNTVTLELTETQIATQDCESGTLLKYTLNYTYQEVWDALEQGYLIPLLRVIDIDGLMWGNVIEYIAPWYDTELDKYVVSIHDFEGTTYDLVASNPNEYPSEEYCYEYGE